MSRKDLYIALAILIDVMVILTFSLSGFEKFLDFLNYREIVGLVFWGAFCVPVWFIAKGYVMTVVKIANKKD